ncbi:MAG: lipocalin family protein [bacterium]|nr:lipocalin family protein [bacterium]
MKFILTIAMLLLSAITGFAADPKPVTTVPEIDLSKYMGVWYEIARYDNWFQRKCASHTTATYSLQPDGTIKVVNRCKTADGNWKEAGGVGRKQTPNGSNTKLEVRFAPEWMGWMSMVWGTYWIIDLAPDYSYAVIGDPDRKYLWILARTATIEPTVLQSIRTRLQEIGYDPNLLLFTKQD